MTAMTLIRCLLASCPYLSYQATHVHGAFNCLGWTCTSTPPVNIRALYMTAMTLIRYLLTSCSYLSYQTTHVHCAFRWWTQVGFEPTTSWLPVRRSTCWTTGPCVFVGLGGFEPPTYRVSGECSAKLSYNPLRYKLLHLYLGRMKSLPSSNLIDATNHFPVIRYGQVLDRLLPTPYWQRSPDLNWMKSVSFKQIPPRV